jgi:hypothetical protein
MSDLWPADGIQQQAWRSARRLASKDRRASLDYSRAWHTDKAGRVDD